MARNPIPKYRRQKRSKGADSAFVELSGVRRYLGPYDSPESREAYARVIAEWSAGGGMTPVAAPEITVNELVARFWNWAESYYANPNGDSTSEMEMFRGALRPLTELYGRTRACEFSPSKLKAVRQRMIDAGWCRTYINKQVIRLKRVFKWGAAEELAPAAVYHALQTLAGLKRGRTEAPEPEPVQPVADHAVDATLPHLTPTLRAMVEVQRHTGARPGEIVRMRTADLDVSGSVWVYRPEHHKTKHHGRDRMIYLGPMAQRAVLPFLRTDVQAYLFQPLQSETERRDMMRAARKTPDSCGNGPGKNRKVHPKWGPGERYTADTYAKAVNYACRQAFPAPDGLEGDDLKAWRRDHDWSPGRLRHTFATRVRREHGLEASQILLGHGGTRWRT